MNSLSPKATKLIFLTIVAVGDLEGVSVGCFVDSLVGDFVGLRVLDVDWLGGAGDGIVGKYVGFFDDSNVGLVEGGSDGDADDGKGFDGWWVGDFEGEAVGDADATSVAPADRQLSKTSGRNDKLFLQQPSNVS